MRMAPAKLLVFALLAALASCAGVPEEAPAGPLYIGGLIFENRSSSFISAIRLEVPATGGFVSCGNVAPGGICSSTFPHREWQGHPFEVTWSQLGQIWSSGAMTVTPAPSVIEAGEAEVRVVIPSPGATQVVLVPMKSP